MSDVTTEPMVPPPPVATARELVRAAAPWTIGLLAAIAALYLLAPLARHAPPVPIRVAIYASVAAFFVLVAAAAAAAMPLWRAPSRWLGAGLAGELVLSAVLVWQQVPVAADLARIALAACAGALLSRIVQELSWAFVAACAVALADLWSVLAPSGVSRRIVEQQPEVVLAAAVRVPLLGQRYEDGALVGITDIVFLTLFLVVAWRWGLGLRRNVVVLGLSFVGSFAIAIEFGRIVPALPLLALAFVVLNAPAAWRRRPGVR